MGSFLSSANTKEEIEMALTKAKEISTSAPVVVFRFLQFLSFFIFNGYLIITLIIVVFVFLFPAKPTVVIARG